jgi:hypothetical protein
MSVSGDRFPPGLGSDPGDSGGGTGAIEHCSFTTAINCVIKTIESITTTLTSGESKSVTKIQKRFVLEAAARAVGGLQAIVETRGREERATSLEEIKEAVRQTVEDTIADMRPSLVPPPVPAPVPLLTPTTTRSFSDIVRSQESARPRTALQTRPAIIVSSKTEVTNSAETLKRFKQSVSFRDTTFAPSKVRQVSGTKVRVEFDTEEHRKETLEKIKRPDSTVVAENAKLLKPLIILKGVQKEVPRDELLDIVSQQNIVPKAELRLCFLQKNRNNQLYNAILEVTPAARKRLLEAGRVNLEYQRVHVADFSRFVQCYKCLQFGHTNAKCTIDIHPCAHCASKDHVMANCPAKDDISKLKCFNCVRAGPSDGAASCAHSATDHSCPKISRAKSAMESRTDYGN